MASGCCNVEEARVTALQPYGEEVALKLAVEQTHNCSWSWAGITSSSLEVELKAIVAPGSAGELLL